MIDTQNDPYMRLMETLDKIPHGFPKAKDGVTHLNVLKWIFTKEEADLASKMKLMGETVEELSHRLDLPLEDLEQKLEEMIKRGQILGINTSTGRRYALMPYAGGFYDEILHRMDKESAQLFEDYHSQFEANHTFDTEPAFFKIIPINEVIKSELMIQPFEQAKHIAEQAKSWGIRECICKIQKNLIGDPCKYPTTVCLNFAKKENAFDDHHISKPISLEEALKYLKEAEEAGLVHSTMNIQTGQYMFCNCCTCCCSILRAVSEHDYPLAYVKSNYQISIEKELCEGCETCVDRCQFNALKVIDDICTINLDRCVGCGVCAVTCPENALYLIARPENEQSTPPLSLRDWMSQKAMSRNVDPSDLL